MTPGCKRLHSRECGFCDRFWRWVIAYVLPIGILIAAGGCAGAVVGFYWAGAL